MNAHGRARDDRAYAIGVWGATAILVAGLLAGCGSPPTVSPSAAPTSSPTPVATATPVAFADTLRVGWNGGPPTDQTTAYAIRGFRGWLLSTATTTISLPSLLYSALYRYDAHYNAIPDLADGPCAPQGDGTVIRCRIVETTFHDGTPLTVDDVANSYRVWTSSYGFPEPGLTEVRVVDPRTVDFALSAVDATFMTEVLPTVPIFSQRDVEARVADFTAAATGLSKEDLVALADSIDEELGRDPPLCTTRLDEVDALFAKLGARLYREDFPGADGRFDPCAFMQTVSYLVRWIVAEGLGYAGYDAAMAALVAFAWFRPPVGTGPYRLVSESADTVHLEAWAGYHGDLAATKYIDFAPTKADGSDLVAGTVDVFQSSSVDSAYQLSAASHGVAVATPPANGYIALFFNVRAGRLFAERSLRQALQLCIDLPRDVDAATAGSATPVYGPVLPGSWADDASLPKPLRDTAAAKQLIEGAGWTLGTDGVYEKNGVRLAADIVTRAGKDDRIKMADLIARQARDCGMELRSRPVPWDDIVLENGMFSYPFNIPGTSTPFDLYIGGWSLGADPASGLADYITSAITDAEHNDWSTYTNVTGFSDPAYDRLVEAGKATYDQAERTRIYREAQEELASQLPVIFLWNGWSAIDVVRTAVATVDGPLDLTAPNWAWQPERMVVASP
jgi:ABC-type transport system substrate-binding protein